MLYSLNSRNQSLSEMKHGSQNASMEGRTKQRPWIVSNAHNSFNRHTSISKGHKTAQFNKSFSHKKEKEVAKEAYADEPGLGCTS